MATAILLRIGPRERVFQKRPVEGGDMIGDDQHRLIGLKRAVRDDCGLANSQTSGRIIDSRKATRSQRMAAAKASADRDRLLLEPVLFPPRSQKRDRGHPAVVG